MNIYVYIYIHHTQVTLYWHGWQLIILSRFIEYWMGDVYSETLKFYGWLVICLLFTVCPWYLRTPITMHIVNVYNCTPLGTNFNEILIEILTFWFKKMHLKMSSAKWRPFCLGLNVLTTLHIWRLGFRYAGDVWAIPLVHFECMVSWCSSRWAQNTEVSKSWLRHQMETFSALLALCVGNSPVTGEFPSQRPVTGSFGDFSDLRLNKRLSKQSWGWWFKTP